MPPPSSKPIHPMHARVTIVTPGRTITLDGTAWSYTEDDSGIDITIRCKARDFWLRALDGITPPPAQPENQPSMFDTTT